MFSKLVRSCWPARQRQLLSGLAKLGLHNLPSTHTHGQGCRAGLKCGACLHVYFSKVLSACWGGELLMSQCAVSSTSESWPERSAFRAACGGHDQTAQPVVREEWGMGRRLQTTQLNLQMRALGVKACLLVSLSDVPKGCACGTFAD